MTTVVYVQILFDLLTQKRNDTCMFSKPLYPLLKTVLIYTVFYPRDKFVFTKHIIFCICEVV